MLGTWMILFWCLSAGFVIFSIVDAFRHAHPLKPARQRHPGL